MQNSPNPTSDRKSAEMPFAAAGSPPESGTIAESLSKIRELLHEFDEGGGRSASATGSVPATDEFREAEPGVSSDDAVAAPNSIPAAMPRRRNGIAVAALAVGGLAVLGTAGLVSAGRPDLPLLAASPAGTGQAAVGNQPEAMAWAALPPARGAAVAKGDVMPKPPASTGHGAPRNAGNGAWRLPPAEARTATPVIVLGAWDQSGGKRPDRSSQVAIAEQASKFIDSYWEQSDASGDETLRYLSSLYAPVVDYYGRQRTRDSVLQDKHAFLRRWPIRQTWPVSAAGNPMISCDRARAECAITGLRDFAAENPKRDARSTGVVRYSYMVRFVNGTAQIVAESSKIVATDAIAIGSPAALRPSR